MRLRLAILLAAIAPAGASLADQAQMTLRGSKSEKEEPADVVSTVTKGSRNRPVKTNAMGDDGSRKRNQRKNGGDGIVDERFVAEPAEVVSTVTKGGGSRPVKINAMGDDGTRRKKPRKNGGEGNVDETFVAVPKEAAAVTVGEIETVAKLKPIKKNDYVDKATYRAQKKAERAAELAEKESEREAEKALREAKKADKEAKKAELKAEKAQQEAEQPAEKDGKKKKKAALKKTLEAADNSTSIDEAEDESSNLSLLSDEDGWMPTPSPIEVLTPWPTEPPVALICPDEFDPERTEPYKAGDHVTVEASIFECQAGDFEEFCSIAELTNDIKKEHKDAKKLWKEAWKYVSPCTAAESASDELVEVNDTVEAETEDTSVIEIADVEDAAVEAEIEGEVAIDGAVDIDSLLQPRSAGLEQHNWDMGFEFAEEPCVSDVCSHQISDICLLHYQVNAPQGNDPSTITMELICEGVTWLGIGFSQDGQMAGSEAVIGVLGQKPRKYNLDGRYMGGVNPMEDSQQTLIDASINVYRGPITVLKFTKIMREQGEIELSPGDNTFLYAQGQSYFLAHHASRGSFQLNLPSVEAPVVDMDRSFDDVTETAITTVAPTTTVLDQPCTTEWCVEELGTECVLKYVVNYPVDEPSSITMDFTCAGEAWIGIGFSLDGIMDGSEAVIAGVGQEPRKYHLGGKWFGPGGVGEMPESQQTLIDTKVRVKWVEGSNGLVPLMKMRFTKLLSEPNEIEIRPGENLFLYAQGSTPSFPSYHAARDSFALTLPSNGSDSGTDTSATVAPAVPEMQVTELSDECTLKHVVNVPPYTTRDECEDCSVTMELTCDSAAWVAVGFSVDGFMPRSEAVIGIPGKNPEKHFLKRRNINRIFRLPDEAQTLTDASVTVDDGGTVMRFTKMLNEPEEIPITQGLYFLFAFGQNENFGYHGPNSRGRFRLNL